MSNERFKRDMQRFLTLHSTVDQAAGNIARWNARATQLSLLLDHRRKLGMSQQESFTLGLMYRQLRDWIGSVFAGKSAALPLYGLDVIEAKIMSWVTKAQEVSDD